MKNTNKIDIHNVKKNIFLEFFRVFVKNLAKERPRRLFNHQRSRYGFMKDFFLIRSDCKKIHIKYRHGSYNDFIKDQRIVKLIIQTMPR